MKKCACNNSSLHVVFCNSDYMSKGGHNGAVIPSVYKAFHIAVSLLLFYFYFSTL